MGGRSREAGNGAGRKEGEVEVGKGVRRVD